MKQLLMAVMAFCTAIAANAQMNTKILGTPREETATHIKKLSDGSTIIAGLIYDIQPGEPDLVNNSDVFVLRLDPGGALLWSKIIFSPDNDYLQDMIISANNDDIILVGNSRPGTSSITGNVAKIFRVNTSGALMASHTFRDNLATNTAGEIFFGVTELSNGNIVAVGTNNFLAGSSAGLIAVYDAALNLMYHERYDMASYSDEFTGVTTDGTDIFICGFVRSFNQHDVRISRYTPGVTAGTMVYDNMYDFNPGNNNINNGAQDIYLVNGTLVVNAAVSVDCCYASNSMQAIMRLDLNGNVYDIRVLNTATYANTMRIVPITNDRVFFVQNPATTMFDPYAQGYISNVDAVVGDLTLSSSTQTLTKIFSNVGDQAVTDIINDGSTLRMVGTINNGSVSFGNRDIYYVSSAYSLTDTKQECDISDYHYTIIAPTTTPYMVGAGLSTINLEPVQPVQIQDIAMQMQMLCGDEIDTPTSTNCDEQCYWTLNGNSNVTGSNFIGSINNAELRFRTVNQERGIFDTDGDFGINLPAGSLPDAKLHVFCDNGEQNMQGHSNVRFEDLMSGNGDMLVIDGSGFVYRAPAGSAMLKQQERIANLEAQIAQLQEQINSIANGRSPVASGASFNVYPNPANNEVSVEYNLNNKADNGTIIFTDAAGKTVFTQNVHGNTGKVQVTIPATVVSGNLICTLLANGETIASQKLSVTKH